MGSTSLNLARAVVGIIGAGALVMAISTLMSGASLSDPVFPAGLAMGAFAVGAAAWVVTPGTLPAIVTWLGLLGLVVTIVIFGEMAFGTPNAGADVFALFLIPATLVAAAVVRMAIARRSVPAGI